MGTIEDKPLQSEARSEETRTELILSVQYGSAEIGSQRAII